ncbi:ergothioneine biosynthesis protein EgtB [Brevundimonas sp. 2R-24]|uniref:Ergothioneine biosynthesis protein EgtB n=1 Tax=Peiella sedimenti TaxID=3061083 RepID=A0ABT8SP29_9CAUL|nr:ergothioneine biosynthesis protein EgtB [Caulobacteraceae bacterium XZ-24]
MNAPLTSLCPGWTVSLDEYRRVRACTEALARPLSDEDCVAQSMPDASPVKWHLAHTTWFFERVVLAKTGRAVDPIHDRLFNSYYEAVGERVARPSRGLLTRPSRAEVMAYRARVDEAMADLLSRPAPAGELDGLVQLGLQHEQQHQELILTDVLHLFSCSPLEPAYGPAPRLQAATGEGRFLAIEGGVYPVGADHVGFAYDNEQPRHDALVRDFEISDRLVTNGEWLAFMEDGGYRRPELWLSDGWAAVQSENWRAPGYWRRDDGDWSQFTLQGRAPIDPSLPVSHISFYEADAFARWAGKRLPTEFEWEVAASKAGLCQVYDGVWQWTASAYTPYPGFQPEPGVVAEYNGKFMCNQMVARGGSFATSPGHTRATYRTFFYPHQRWQFLGLRLAADRQRPARRPQPDDFTAALIEGLSASPKTLSPKWLYDARGSELFEQITDLAEYYPTRTETALLRRIAPEIAARLGSGATLIELGSGASEKTRLLLDAAPQVSRYIPIDISPSALEAAAEALRRDYPDLEVAPVEADFTRDVPRVNAASDRLVFFPGSTIGNFQPDEAAALLTRARKAAGEGAWMVLGVDLVKDVSVLEAAYDDARGVTAAFNMNLLERANRETGADFDLARFKHRAVWNADLKRIEMHLVSLTDQTVSVAGRSFRFARGESLHSESSHKFERVDLERLAHQGGWSVERVWTDPKDWFALALLRA